jgi:hypothetical protein
VLAKVEVDCTGFAGPFTFKVLAEPSYVEITGSHGFIVLAEPSSTSVAEYGETEPCREDPAADTTVVSAI